MRNCPNDPFNGKRSDLPCRCDNCMRERERGANRAFYTPSTEKGACMKYIVVNWTDKEERTPFASLAEALNFCLDTDGALEVIDDDGIIVSSVSAEDGRRFDEEGRRA